MSPSWATIGPPGRAVDGSGEELEVGAAVGGDDDELAVEDGVAQGAERPNLGDPGRHVVAAPRPQPAPAGGHLSDQRSPSSFISCAHPSRLGGASAALSSIGWYGAAITLPVWGLVRQAVGLTVRNDVGGG